MPLETMLRIYFLQHWFNLSDPQAEDMRYDSESMRRFARVELGEDTVPDESTILRFRHLLEAHQLTAQMFDAVRDLLVDRDRLVTTGTIVDATRIAAPSSTKHATTTRDPAMRQTRTGRTWHVGMTGHLGTDPRGFVHTLITPNAAQSDIGQLPHLVHGLEDTRHGDKAYWKEADRVAYEAAGGQYLINQRGERTPERDALNRERSRIRARGEHPALQAVPPGIACAHPRARRASVSRREGVVGLHEGPLSRVAEELRAGVRGLRARQPLPRPQTTTAGGHVVSA
jgi:IS5 family transposase